MKSFEKNTFVMNNKTGKAYMITTDTVQTRNRRQVLGMGIVKPEITQIAESHLSELSDFGMALCHEAERIMRSKQKVATLQEKEIMTAWRALKDSIVK